MDRSKGHGVIIAGESLGSTVTTLVGSTPFSRRAI